MVAIAFGSFQLFMPSGVDSVPLGCFLMLLASLVACHDEVRLVVFWSSIRDGVWVMSGLYGSAGSVLVYHTILHAPHPFWSECYWMPWTQSRFLWFIPTWKTFYPLIFRFLIDAPCGVSTRSQSCPRFQCVPYCHRRLSGRTYGLRCRIFCWCGIFGSFCQHTKPLHDWCAHLCPPTPSGLPWPRLLLLIVICLSQRLSDACISMN